MLAKALKLSRSERRLALQAGARLVAATVLMKWVSLERLRRGTPVRARFTRHAPRPALDAAQAVHYRRALQRAARCLPRTTCLTESLALWWLLQRHGFAVELRIGVRKRDECLLAHAWLESAGRIIFDHQIAHRYVPFSDPLLGTAERG